ncbi:MAG TPA: tRNA (adenosine(37)-N6)-threonylcarbamoyltransferase complex dimerization subunit type 1 TsaB [Gemmatimonadales bacterium]|nr:tRNA (adenosine(37)-N6)-threonylcarbamoyltransferase complex dimerization subunit type 1 TsaB [Gemmatimonadales bacterium]
MNTLAIDAATDRLSVAVAAADGQRVERHLMGARGHARNMILMIEELLRVTGATSPAAISRVVLADGPGSFTGLRVAAAVAKALGRAGRAQLWTAPSLLGRAWTARGGRPGLVLSASSALRGEIYAGWYDLAHDRAVHVVHPAVAMGFDEVRAGRRPDCIVGDASDGMLEALAAYWGVPLVSREESQADARGLLELLEVPGAVSFVGEPDRWEPTYGRPAEAQAKWEREHGRPLPDSTGHSG